MNFSFPDVAEFLWKKSRALLSKKNEKTYICEYT